MQQHPNAHEEAPHHSLQVEDPSRPRFVLLVGCESAVSRCDHCEPRRVLSFVLSSTMLGHSTSYVCPLEDAMRKSLRSFEGSSHFVHVRARWWCHWWVVKPAGGATEAERDGVALIEPTDSTTGSQSPPASERSSHPVVGNDYNARTFVWLLIARQFY